MNTPATLDEKTLHIVAMKARDLKNDPRHGRCFAGYDLADIEMDFTLYLLERMPAFDPASGGWEEFVRARLRHKKIDMIRERYTFNETRRRADMSLEQPVCRDEEGRDITLGETLATHGLSLADEVALRLDLQDRLDCLPANLRPVAEMLSTRTQGEAAECLGISRFAFRRRYLARLRAALDGLAG